MEPQRNELQHYKKVIIDEEIAEKSLSNVLQTRREVVRQFLKHYGPGIQRLAPSSAQVMNARRAESELDAHSIEPLPQNICATQTKARPGNVLMSRYNQHQGTGTHRKWTRYKFKGSYNRNSDILASNQGGAHHDRDDTRKCWSCH